MGMNMYAISVSRDHNWIVCSTVWEASVWDGEMQEKVISNVEGTHAVYTVDVSPDPTRFATGTDEDASIWSITTGQRLGGGLLKHGDAVAAIRFSPTGEHIATACAGNSIHIFDSHTGDKLVNINNVISGWVGVAPLAWSSNGQQIFATSRDNKIRSFDVYTGSQRAESQILDDLRSIALAANGKFIAAVTPQSISFLNTSTFKQIGPIIEESKKIRPIAISVDNSYLATGLLDGRVIIRDLSKCLPDLYGPFHVSHMILSC